MEQTLILNINITFPLPESCKFSFDENLDDFNYGKHQSQWFL